MCLKIAYRIIFFVFRFICYSFFVFGDHFPISDVSNRVCWFYIYFGIGRFLVMNISIVALKIDKVIVHSFNAGKTLKTESVNI